MGVVHVIKTPKSPQMWFIASDWHGHSLDESCFNILINHALLLPKEQRNLIINGDFLDTPYFMPKNPAFQEWKDRKNGVDDFFLPQWEDEIKWGNEKLDEIQCVFNHVVFINGNHDSPRIDLFREKYCPSGYQEHFHIHRKLNLEKRNIGHIGYNDWLDIGDISVTHGQAHGSSSHKKHFEMSGGRNVIFGHIHHYECRTFATRGNSRSVWSLPAMCNLNPEYIKNTEVNWQNGYGTIYMKPSGDFNFNVHIVKNNELLLPSGYILVSNKTPPF